MAKRRIELSEVLVKDLKVVLYLVASWAVGLAVVFLSGDERYLGLIPVANYVIYRLSQELSNQGYRSALKK
jgi:hypothetical protein